MDRAIITSASNKFFPSLINLLGSIKQNYPQAPQIFIYDLGLSWNFRKELEQMENVQVISMPHFCAFWRSCYTWKTYILSHPLADLNFYVDAGAQVLRPLDNFFEIIDKDNYLAVGQEGTLLSFITPEEYKPIFPIDNRFYEQQCITAGVFGFKDESKMREILNELYSLAQAGLTLGFSVVDRQRNKGVNKSSFTRNCKLFRHDTTLLSLVMRKYLNDFTVRDCRQYAGPDTDHDHPQQYIWNMRLNFKSLQYLGSKNLYEKSTALVKVNRLIIQTMLLVKKIMNNFKKRFKYK